MSGQSTPGAAFGITQEVRFVESFVVEGPWQRRLTHQRASELARAEGALRQSQKMEAVGQLTGGLAHDFNNLLAGISGSLELAQTRIAQGKVNSIDKYILVARGAVKRAASLTHRLLAFSRRQTLDPKPTNVNRLVADMQELITRTVGPAVHLEVVGAGGLWSTLVDPNQLENALLNLCINARDAMPDGGRLTIETANKWLDERSASERDLPAGQYVSLCITDTGVGMSPEVAAKAFDPFFTTKPLERERGWVFRWSTDSRGNRAGRYASIPSSDRARRCASTCLATIGFPARTFPTSRPCNCRLHPMGRSCW